MATERLPGYDVLVGCYEEDVHRANLADDNWLYFIGLDASGTPQGFAVLPEKLEALHPPPQRSIRHCERQSPGPKGNARVFRQSYTR
jgi:hypothetical protein